MESPVEAISANHSQTTIAHLASLQARAASQEHHVRFLEATLERRAEGLAALHRSTSLLSRRIAEVQQRSTDISLASEDAAPSRIPQTPATTPSSSSSSSSTGAPSRLALAPLSVGSAFLPTAADKARAKLRDDAASFAELCDAALADFEASWDEGAERVRSWAEVSGPVEPSSKGKGKRQAKCVQGLGSETSELCLKVVKLAAESPEHVAERIIKSDGPALQALMKRAEPGGASPLELILGVLGIVGGDEALLCFVQRLFELAVQRDSDVVQVDALLLATLDVLAHIDTASTTDGAPGSLLTLSPSAELYLLGYLRDCAREEGSTAGDNARALVLQGQPSRISPRSVTPRGARQRRISTPSQSSLSALGTLSSSAAEYLTSGVSGVTSGLSSISGFFGGGRGETPASDGQGAPPPPRSAPPAWAMSRFVSSPAPSTSGISFPSVTPTAHEKGEAAAGLDEVKEDLEAVLHAHPRQGTSSDRAVMIDPRSKLGQGQPSVARRRTISEAQSNALRQGNIRTIRLEREEQATPALASRAAEGFLERLCLHASADVSPLAPSGLVMTLCRSLLGQRFPSDRSPAQHRRVKLLIVVRWFGFAHLRQLMCQPGRVLRGDAWHGLGGPIVASADPRQAVTQPGPMRPPSLFEAVWTADQDTQLRLSNLHRAVYARIVEATTQATTGDAPSSATTGAQTLLSMFEGAAAKEGASSAAKAVRASLISSLTLTWRDAKTLLEVLGPAAVAAPAPDKEGGDSPASKSAGDSPASKSAGDSPASKSAGDSPASRSAAQHQSPSSITHEELSKALEEVAAPEHLASDAPPTMLFTARTSGGRAVIKDSITTLRQVLDVKDGQPESTSSVNGRAANDAATSPTKAFFMRRHGNVDPATRAPTASSVFGTSESTAGGSGFADSTWGEEPSSPFHDTLREGKPSYFEVATWGTQQAAPAPMATAIERPSQDGQATTAVPPRAIPSRRGSFRGNAPPSAWRQGSNPTPSSTTPTSLSIPRSLPPASRIPPLPEASAHQVRRALSCLCKGQYLAQLPCQPATIPSKLFDAASLSARGAMRFDDAFLFGEAAQAIRDGARETVAQGLRDEGSAEAQLVESILSTLARPLALAERARAARIEAAHRALAEVDVQLTSLRRAARDLLRISHEARCRVWYAAHIRALPQVIEARRASQALLHSSSLEGEGGLANNIEAAGQAASQWMAELGIYDFELDSTLKAYVRELEPIFAAIAGEASTFFGSGLWSREAALARPLMARGADSTDADSFLAKQAHDKVVLSFGRCSRSLLHPGEKPPTIRSGLEDHFLQRVQLLSTGFFLCEALGVVRESSVDERLRKALMETRPSAAAQNRAGPSALARRLEKACAGELLQRFDLDPSPRSKLRSILVLERLVSAAMRSQRAEDQRAPAKQASDEGLTGQPSAGADEEREEAEPEGAKTPTVRGAGVAPSSSPVAKRRPLMGRQNSDRPAGNPAPSTQTQTDDVGATSSPRRPLSVRSTAHMPRRVLSLYDDEDAMSVASGYTYGAQPHAGAALHKPLDSIQDLLANLEALETGQRAIGRWRLMAAQQQQQQQQQQHHSQQSSSAAQSQGGPSSSQRPPSHGQDLAGSMSEHSESGRAQRASPSSQQRQGEPIAASGSSHGASSRAPSASAGISEMGSLRGRPPSVGVSTAGEARVGGKVPTYAEREEGEGQEGDEQGEGDEARSETDDFEPTTDDMVGALEEILALGSPTGARLEGDPLSSSSRATGAGAGFAPPRELLLNLQIVAAFTPTTILDLKDEGKAFWDLCLAAGMQRQLAGIDGPAVASAEGS